MSCRCAPGRRRTSGSSAPRESPDRFCKTASSPVMRRRKKSNGQWNIRTRILFPGYVFLDTEDIDQVFIRLRSVIGLTRILGTGEEIVPLTEREMEFLLQFGGEEQIVGMSEGIIEGSRIRILSGPLVGKEALIRRIDRHKRKAYLEMDMFGRTQRIQVGLEVVMKTRPSS